ncbi:MAG: hemerythrin domain-containing protein [Chloroflexi bacterium]|nr:hemerythrin domain-containing protein [Chloroflexota bacterium]
MAYEEFFNLIKQQHVKVKDELTRLQKVTSTSEAMELWSQFKRDIVPHLKGEEKYFYGALQKSPDCKEVSDKALGEHHWATGVLNELDQMPKNEDWAVKLAGFKDAIFGHITFEEGEVFAKARQCLGETQLRDILTNYKDEEKRVLATMAT